MQQGLIMYDFSLFAVGIHYCKVWMQGLFLKELLALMFVWKCVSWSVKSLLRENLNIMHVRGQAVSTDYVNPNNDLMTLSQRLQGLCSSVRFTEIIHCTVEA